MKKLISLLLVLAMAVSLCACTADPAQQSDPSQDPTASVDTTGAAAAGDEKDDDEINLEDINEFEPNAKGIYQIHSAEGLKNVANVLDGKFELLCDIDLGGAEWVPVGTQDAPFTGRLNGKNFTVSNFTISQPTEDGNMGFVGVNNGSIINLYLKDVTVNTTDKTVNVGTIAGVSNGDILRTEAYGTINAAELAENASCGGAVGVATEILEYVVTEVDVNCDAKTAANVGTAVGTLEGGKLLYGTYGGAMTVADDTNKNVGTLVGSVSDGTVEENSYNGDTAVLANSGKVRLFGLARNTTETGNATRYTGYQQTFSADAEARRDKVVELGFQMASTPWVVDEYMQYKNVCSCCDTRTFSPGTTYRGIPYNHYNGSWQRFMYAMEENADGDLTVAQWARELTSYNGYDTWAAYIGNDCCSAMIQLYQCVSNTCNIKRAIYQFPWFDEEYVETMEEETFPIGISGAIPVGGWEYDFIELDPNTHASDGLSRYVQEQPEDPETGLSGVERMYWCYAQMNKGDMTQNSIKRSDGHCLMIVEDPYVYLDSDGNIDPNKSYVRTIQQRQGFYSTSASDSQYNEAYISSWWFEGDKCNYTFAQLAEQNYVPVTFIELIEGSDETPEVTHEDAQEGRFALTSGTIKSNFIMDSVEVTVTDDAGNEVMNKRMFITMDRDSDQGTNTWNTRIDIKEFDMGHFAPVVAQVNWDTSKTYHCTIKAYLTSEMIDNNVITVSEFTF